MITQQCKTWRKYDTTEWTQFSSNWLQRDGDLKFNLRKNEKEWRKPNKNHGLPVRKIVCFIEDFPSGSDGKASVYRAGDLDSIPGSEDPWRRKWQSTPVLLPGKSHGQRILVGYGPWGRKELDTTEQIHFLSFY